MAGSLHKFTVQEAQNASLGQARAIMVKGVNEVTCKNGVFVAITFLENSIFGSLTSEDTQMYPDGVGTGTDISATNGDNVLTETFHKGVTIYGRWTSFKLASGLAIAYRG